MTLAQLIRLLQSSVCFGTVIMYGSVGEILTEKSGNLNLGVPGIMYLGGISGLAASFFYEFNNPNPSPVICLLLSFVAAFLASALGGLLYSFLTITLRANQNVTGLTLTIFGGGVANFFGGSLNTMAGGVGQISVATTSAVYRATIPGLSNLGTVGALLFNYGFMVYLAIVVAIAMNWFLNRTRKGLNLRAVGENPATADAAGINVSAYRYGATCIGCAISALGGLTFIMDNLNGNWEYIIDAMGWLSVALVIFTVWKPNIGILGSIIFGGLYIAASYINGIDLATKELFKILPYFVTVVVLIITSIKNKRENQPPAGLGANYFREDR